MWVLQLGCALIMTLVELMGERCMDARLTPWCSIMKAWRGLWWVGFGQDSECLGPVYILEASQWDVKSGQEHTWAWGPGER